MQQLKINTIFNTIQYMPFITTLYDELLLYFVWVEASSINNYFLPALLAEKDPGQWNYKHIAVFILFESYTMV